MVVAIGPQINFVQFIFYTVITYFVFNLFVRSRLNRRLMMSLFLINVFTLATIYILETIIQPQNVQDTTYILLGVQTAIVFGFIILYKSKIITPLRKLIKKTNQMADGDIISIKDEKISGVGEIKTLVHATGIVASRFRSIVTNIKNSTIALSEAAEELASGSEEVAATTEEVTGTIQTIAEGAAEQVRRLDEVSKILNDMVRVTEESIHQINLTSKITLDLAEQTNLVSLNAAIEASKASGESEGFQVVADHVRQLSVESKTASNTVTQVSREISERMRDAVEKIIDAVDTITSVAENTAASAQEAAAAAEEQSAALQEITQQAQKLSELSEKTERSIEEFKIS